MKTARIVVAVVVLSGFLAYSAFFIPGSEAGHHGHGGYSRPIVGNYYGGSDHRGRYHHSNYGGRHGGNWGHRAAYYDWPESSDWFGPNQWLDRGSWGYQNQWFANRYCDFDRYGAVGFGYDDSSFYRYDDNYALWQSDWDDGYRSVYWNYSNQPIMGLSNYYANFGLDDISSPVYARSLAFVDANNPSNVIIILNANNAIDSGFYGLDRASISLGSDSYSNLASNIMEEYGSDYRMNYDYSNGRLSYDDGGQSMDVTFRGEPAETGYRTAAAAAPRPSTPSASYRTAAAAAPRPSTPAVQRPDYHYQIPEGQVQPRINYTPTAQASTAARTGTNTGMRSPATNAYSAPYSSN